MDIETVILAGGMGSRLGNLTRLIPKPMITIGKIPILLHIMHYYSYFGFYNFTIALGYKGNVIKKYFKKKSRFFCKKKNFIFCDFINQPNWKIKLVDTGKSTMTGGRLLRLKKIINTENFFFTYGDGLSNINLKNLLKFHYKNKKIGTVSAVHPVARFGELIIKKGLVKSFKEKPQTKKDWINGGYFVLNKKIFKYIRNDCSIFEKTPLEMLSNDKQLLAYKHKGFWQCMDTPRDRDLLIELYNNNEAPWKIWKK